MAVDIWAKCYEGETLSEVESLMFDSKLIEPNQINFHRIYIGEFVERLRFADGSVFRRATDGD